MKHRLFRPMRIWVPLAGRGFTASVNLPAEKIEAIAFSGIEPRHVHSVELRINGLTVVDIGPGVDGDYNPITGGEVMVAVWGLQRFPLVGARFGLVLEMDVGRVHDARLTLITTADAPMDLDRLVLDCMVPMPIPGGFF